MKQREIIYSTPADILVDIYILQVHQKIWIWNLQLAQIKNVSANQFNHNGNKLQIIRMTTSCTEAITCYPKSIPT